MNDRPGPKPSDKVVGRAKQLIAEVLGDAKLQKEGRDQERQEEQEGPPRGPFDRLSKLS